MQVKGIRFLVVVALLFSMFVVGCGGGGGGGTGTGSSGGGGSSSPNPPNPPPTSTGVKVVLDYSQGNARAAGVAKAIPATATIFEIHIQNRTTDADIVPPVTVDRQPGTQQVVNFDNVTPGTYEVMIRMLDSNKNYVGSFCQQIEVQADLTNTVLVTGTTPPASVAVTPQSPTTLIGATQAFVATATYSDGFARNATVDATWNSGTPAVATINTLGVVTGVAKGTSLITATLETISGSTTLTVPAKSVTWNPAAWTVQQNREALTKVASDGNGHFVTVGNLGTIFTSPDGSTWTQITSGTLSDLTAVCYAPALGKFVAVGLDGTILTSTNKGATWAVQTQSLSLAGVTYGANMFVAVGGSNVLTSTDGGATWIPHLPVDTGIPATTNLNGVAITDNGGIYAAGQDFSTDMATIWSSTDGGVTWVQPTFASPMPLTSRFTGVAFGTIDPAGSNTPYIVAVGWYTDQSNQNLGNMPLLVHGVAVAPADVDIFNQDTAPTTTTTPYNMDVIFTGQNFLAVGDTAYVFDGSAWTAPATDLQISGNSSSYWPSVAYDPLLALYVAVGAAGHITTCAAPTTWTMVTTGSSADILGLTFGQTQYVAVGGNTILESADTLNWSPDTFDGLPVGAGFNAVSVTYGLTSTVDTFVAVGNGQTSPIYTKGVSGSPAGSDWTAVQGLSSSLSLMAVTFGTDRYVAVGLNGTILNSLNGTTWTPAVTVIPPETTLTGLATDGTHFVAIGYDNSGPVVYTSPDGANWTLVSLGAVTPAVNDLTGIAWGNNMFVAVGNSTTSTPEIITSTDFGATWTAVTQALAGYAPETVAFGNGHFVVTIWAGLNEGILDSTDGQTWTLYNLPTENYLPALTCGNGIFVAGGTWGEILANPGGAASAASSMKGLSIPRAASQRRSSTQRFQRIIR